MKKIGLKPTAGYVLVEPVESEKQTSSGIVLPESHEEKPSKGKVLKVGGAIYAEGHETLSPAKVGDVVVYKKWGGNEYKIEDKELLFIKFEDILAIEE